MTAKVTTNGVLTPCEAAIRLFADSQDTQLCTAPAGSAASTLARSALTWVALPAWAKV